MPNLRAGLNGFGTSYRAIESPMHAIFYIDPVLFIPSILSCMYVIRKVISVGDFKP